MSVRLTITRRATFAAAHRLYHPDWSEERNAEVFGPCANLGGHGHNYVVEVTIGGELDPATGMIVDLKWLKQVMEREVINLVDHRNLNTDVAFLRGLNPTAENLALAFWDRLQEPVSQQAQLVRLVVIETENNRATIEVS